MPELIIEDLTGGPVRAGRDGPVLSDINLSVAAGEVHVIMGPNGSGKSTLAHILAGRPGYRVERGSVRLDGLELTGLPAWRRAQAGLFLAPQDPTEIVGVTTGQVIREALRARGLEVGDLRERMVAEATAVGLDPALLDRYLNVDFSGGEKKRNETVQLALLRPRVAVLDEIDSGLDIDALRAVSRRLEAMTNEGTGIIAITHYTRLLRELKADRVHILISGRIVDTGGPELAERLDREGYGAWVAQPIARRRRR